jgi:hypothetical protein
VQPRVSSVVAGLLRTISEPPTFATHSCKRAPWPDYLPRTLPDTHGAKASARPCRTWQSHGRGHSSTRPRPGALDGYCHCSPSCHPGSCWWVPGPEQAGKAGRRATPMARLSPCSPAPCCSSATGARAARGGRGGHACWATMMHSGSTPRHKARALSTLTAQAQDRVAMATRGHYGAKLAAGPGRAVDTALKPLAVLWGGDKRPP